MSEEEKELSAKALAEAYLEYYRSRSKDGSWAWNTVTERLASLETGVSVTLELVSAARDAAEIAYVAAGPVEEMLRRHGNAALSRFAEEARHSGSMRRALEGVWLGPQDQAFAGWVELALQYGLTIEIPRPRAGNGEGGEGESASRQPMPDHGGLAADDSAGLLTEALAAWDRRKPKLTEAQRRRNRELLEELWKSSPKE